LLLHTAEIGDTIVEYSAWTDGMNQDRVRLVFERCIAVRHVPEHLSEASDRTDVGELPESGWLGALHKEQARLFPSMPEHFRSIRHYFVVGHDTIIEVLAEGLGWRLLNAGEALPMTAA
jgi:hypothetical protein